MFFGDRGYFRGGHRFLGRIGGRFGGRGFAFPRSGRFAGGAWEAQGDAGEDEPRRVESVGRRERFDGGAVRERRSPRACRPAGRRRQHLRPSSTFLRRRFRPLRSPRLGGSGDPGEEEPRGSSPLADASASTLCRRVPRSPRACRPARPRSRRPRPSSTRVLPAEGSATSTAGRSLLRDHQTAAGDQLGFDRETVGRGERFDAEAVRRGHRGQGLAGGDHVCERVCLHGDRKECRREGCDRESRGRAGTHASRFTAACRDVDRCKRRFRQTPRRRQS